MKKQILVIDDDRDFVTAMKCLLEGNGYEVAVAVNGAQGMEKIAQRVPDAVLLDIMLAHATEGYGIARQLRDNPETSTVPIIVVTGIRNRMNADSPKLTEDDEWLPVDVILEKPLKTSQLLNLLSGFFTEAD